MPLYFTNILYSQTADSYYIGYSSNLELRVIKHNEGSTTCTKNGILWQVVYYETFESKSEAIKREKHI